MTSHINVNRRIVLNSRPNGMPKTENFRLEVLSVPVPSAGQVQLRTLYLSLDPYMRCRMSDASTCPAPVALGEVMIGGTVSRVEESRHPGFKPGDLVHSYNGWQEFAVSDGTDLTRLDAGMVQSSLTLGALGMPGFAAYTGLIDIGRPKKGETVVVAAACGGVGSIVGQIAKLKGCHVVGIAGDAEKCCFAFEELGFDACINRRRFNFPQKLADACPHGIDVYFESVGGAVFDAVLPLLNDGARVPLCGLISQYNDTDVPPDHEKQDHLTRALLDRRIKMQGFTINEYGNRFEEFYRQMTAWLADGSIKYREDIVNGIENAPRAFIGMLDGKNFGKQAVRISRA